jgi:hypothetical protein
LIWCWCSGEQEEEEEEEVVVVVVKNWNKSLKLGKGRDIRRKGRDGGKDRWCLAYSARTREKSDTRA